MNKRIIDGMNTLGENIDGMNTLGENYIFRDVTKTINFNIDDRTEKLRLDEKGFYYNDQFIEDAGIAYSRFMEWLDSAGFRRGGTAPWEPEVKDD